MKKQNIVAVLLVAILVAGMCAMTVLPTTADGAWVIQLVDSTGNVGMHSSLALDAFGKPHISYYDYGNADLKYAYIPDDIHSVTTATPSSINSSAADSGGNVTSDGGETVTARGVCWSTSADPTTADSHTTDGTGTGSFSSSITGLSPATLYHVRAYATNSIGTAYGQDLTLTTQCTVTASVSGDHGSVDPASRTVDYNTSVSIDLIPEDGYNVVTITDNGVPQSISDPYVISNVTEDHEVVVTFTYGSISGIVTDGTSNLTGIKVYAYNSSDAMVGKATTADGAYTIGNLPAGDYKVYFYDSAGTYRNEWYNNNNNITSRPSSPNVTVTAGSTTPDIDAALAATGSIAGTVTDGTSNLTGINVYAYDSTNTLMGRATTADGAYTIGNLPADRLYKVYFYDSAGTYVNEWYDNLLSRPAATISVTAGSTTPNIDADMALK